MQIANEFNTNYGSQIIPSVSTLKKLKAQMTVNEGTCPKIYGWIADQFLNNAADSSSKAKQWTGHLMYDEMKLKEDVAWNSTTHELTGLVEGGKGSNVAHELYALVNSDDGISGEKEYEPAKSVQQYRFRSTCNHTVNGEFFYNNGSLTADEILSQLLQVISSFEMIGCKIFMILSDAGGNNSRLFSLLRKGKLLGETSWLTKNIVEFQHPVYPDRKIAMCFCSTHCLKNLRNALFSSLQSRARAFRDVDGEFFGWCHIIALYTYDAVFSKRNRTGLTIASVQPDRWNKMNVSLAKAPFKYEAVIEQIRYAAREFNW